MILCLGMNINLLTEITFLPKVGQIWLAAWPVSLRAIDDARLLELQLDNRAHANLRLYADIFSAPWPVLLIHNEFIR
jgi:hypothetical protein